MTKQIKAMQAALAALKSIDAAMPFPVAKFAIHHLEDALAEALAEQPAQQEPVVWMYQNKSTHQVSFQKHMRAFVDHGVTYETPLYTTPPAQRTWVGLTDEDIDYLCELAYENDEELILTVQAKIKEKNQ